MTKPKNTPADEPKCKTLQCQDGQIKVYNNVGKFIGTIPCPACADECKTCGGSKKVCASCGKKWGPRHYWFCKSIVKQSRLTIPCPDCADECKTCGGSKEVMQGRPEHCDNPEMVPCPDCPPEPGEFVCCAAIKRTDGIILAGRNHAFIIKHSPKDTCRGDNSLQGFITSKARFVGRSEAGEIAFGAGQIKKPTNLLFSEDITQDNPWAGEQITTLQARIGELGRGIIDRDSAIGRRGRRIDELKEKHRWIPVGERLLDLEHSKKRPFASIDLYLTNGKAACVGAYNYSADYWMCPLQDITHYCYITLPKGE